VLKLLKIKNIALITAAELEFGPGLTLLTGETGAGKSIVVDALGLLLGGRASSELIRTGEERAFVEALIEAPRAAGWLETRGLPAEGDEVIIRRELSSSGKGRATVNGALVPAALLRELAPVLAAIHGQHEPQGLLDPEAHLGILDHHAGLTAAAEAVAEAYRRLRAISTELEALRRDRREQERRRETLEFQAAEIEKSRLQPGEEDELRRDKAVQANAERLAALAAEAYALLYEADEAVLTRLGQAFRKVDELARIDARFGPHLETRESVRGPLQDLAAFLRDYRDSLQFSPERLEEVESRLATIERMKRKYGASVEEVIAFAADCRRQLEALGSPEERERQLETERSAAEGAYRSAAASLSEARRRAATELEKKVRRELAELAMEKTRFEVRFAPDEGEGGLERAEFLISPNPGEELRPLAKIASGGELSRIMLALQSVASLDAGGKTLVFDEVDAGIGGRVAEVVGRKLRRIAERHQVLCVTHLPQIASLAESHYAVRKRLERGRTVTEVMRLGAEEHVEEVARMLGGDKLTEAARLHAREMVRQGARG
jgi:DNA repair protein RecN (Recombination protein N)